MIVRCKHRKNPPGDGGIVDGCGWQGEHQAVCPICGSKILREVRQVTEGFDKAIHDWLSAAPHVEVPLTYGNCCRCLDPGNRIALKSGCLGMGRARPQGEHERST